MYAYKYECSIQFKTLNVGINFPGAKQRETVLRKTVRFTHNMLLKYNLY